MRRSLQVLPLVVLIAAAACVQDRSPTAPAAPSVPGLPAGALRWSEASTWPGGVVPTAGSSPVIPKGAVVLLDTSPPPLDQLRIDGTLIFDERDLAVSARTILLYGTLQIGSEGHPFQHRALVTLAGADAGPGTLDPTLKGLVVLAGDLEVHGQPRLAWTRLAATASRGAVQLQLADAPAWRAGDRVAIASTDFDPAQTEDAAIAAVSGTVVTLAQPLRYAHWGVLQSFAGRTLDERAEVGLLTRNVTFQGDSAGSAGGFGGHLMIMGGSTAHIEGAEFYAMGQKGRLARYPIHWHMAGDESGNYARGNSIWHAFNRCLTVHGTDGVLVQDNVCYDDIGHSYFLEDGIEQHNTFEHNLALRARAPEPGQAVIPSDVTPAGFWITNPANTYRGNVAAGSSGFGFWVALPEHPTGLSTTSTVWPRQTPLAQFSDNVAHSNRSGGLFVDNGPNPDGTVATTSYRPQQTPGVASAAVPAAFTGFTAYKHTGRAVWLRGASLALQGATLADNGIGATFAASETVLRHSLIVGQSDNSATSVAASFPIRGYEFYDGRVGAEDVTFVNFTSGARPASAIGFNRSDGFPLNPLNYEQGVTLVNANGVYLEDPHPDKDGDKAAVFLDTDGSLTGEAGDYVVANNPFLVTPACTQRVAWNAWVCRVHYASVRVQGGTGEVVAPLDVARGDGPTMHLVGVPNQPGTAVFSAPVSSTLRLSFAGGAPAHPRILVSNLQSGESLQVTLPVASSRFVVYQDGDSAHPFTVAASPAQVASVADSYYYDGSTGLLYLRATPRAGRNYANLYIDPH